jgi:hypothetical protein
VLSEVVVDGGDLDVLGPEFGDIFPSARSSPSSARAGAGSQEGKWSPCRLTSKHCISGQMCDRCVDTSAALYPQLAHNSPMNSIHAARSNRICHAEMMFSKDTTARPATMQPSKRWREGWTSAGE